MEIYQSAPQFLASIRRTADNPKMTADGLPLVSVSSRLAANLQADSGDRLLLSDHRWWFGGLRSTQVQIESIQEVTDGTDLHLPATLAQRVQAHGEAHIKTERLL